MSFSFLPKIKHYYGISVKLFIYQGRNLWGTMMAAGLASIYIPTGKGVRILAMENGLVGEIRTRIIVVAVRHITFLSPRDSSQPALQRPANSKYIDIAKSREIWTNGD